ncbi:hypothetical protein V8C35DRAFT_159762 [Trichoderma chlorosporum]
MEQLITGLSHITLDPTNEGTYESRFGDIICYAETTRGFKIPAAELNVTSRLAGPFTTGGLLVLLLEPRQYHPWHEGVDGVIAECKTLASLNEAVEIESEKRASLSNGVSVLDLRPFLPKKQYPNRQDDDWGKLYRMVFLAIEAKRPKVLLCMGREAELELISRIEEYPDRYQDTRVVYSIHPSRAVNYEEDDLNERNRLFESIREACDGMRSEWIHETPKRGPVAHAPHIAESTSAENVECLGDFMDVLLRSCFLPNHQLPCLNIRVGSFSRYRLEPWHTLWFHHLENDDPSDCREHQARAYLVPIFRKLNNMFRRTSYFLPQYEVVDWQCVCDLLVNQRLRVWGQCYLLARGKEAVRKGTVIYVRKQGSGKDIDLCHELKRITAHSNMIWEARQPHPVRNRRYVLLLPD